MRKLTVMLAMVVAVTGGQVFAQTAPLEGSGEFTMKGTLDDWVSGGKSWHAKPENGKWTAQLSDYTKNGKPDYLFIYFLANDLQNPPTGVGAFWNLNFGTDKVPADLAVGQYDDAERAPFASAGHPGVDIGGDGRGCNTIAGSFNITAFEYDCYDNAGTLSPRLTKFAATFKQHCERGTSFSEGTVSFTAPAGISCQGGSGDGGGSGSGGGTTPTPPPPPKNVSIVLPEDVFAQPVMMVNSDTKSFEITTVPLGDYSSDLVLSAWSDAPEGSDFEVSVEPALIPAPGAGKATVRIKTGPRTIPRDYLVTVSALANGSEAYYGTFTVSIACDPPMILGLDQPKNTTVASGSTATLNVKATGSGPFTYQWFTGPRGSTHFPITGVTDSKLTTPGEGAYWVRVSNACGSVDSEMITVTRR